MMAMMTLMKENFTTLLGEVNISQPSKKWVEEISHTLADQKRECAVMIIQTLLFLAV